MHQGRGLPKQEEARCTATERFPAPCRERCGREAGSAQQRVGASTRYKAGRGACGGAQEKIPVKRGYVFRSRQIARSVVVCRVPGRLRGIGDGSVVFPAEKGPDRKVVILQRGIAIRGYNSKNLMHTLRLLDMAAEIAAEGLLRVRRPNRDYLLRVRAGEFDYEELVARAEEKLAEIRQAFEHCS